MASAIARSKFPLCFGRQTVGFACLVAQPLAICHCCIPTNKNNGIIIETRSNAKLITILYNAAFFRVPCTVELYPFCSTLRLVSFFVQKLTELCISNFIFAYKEAIKGNCMDRFFIAVTIITSHLKYTAWNQDS